MDKVRGLIGLMMRAGQLTLGESGALLAVRGGTAAGILLDEAASANTRKRFTDACAYRNLPCYLLPADLLAQATGKPGRKVAAMKTGSLAEQLKKTLSPELA